MPPISAAAMDFAAEAHGADPARSVTVTEHLIAANFVDFVPQPIDQFDFMSVDCLHAFFEDKLNASGEPGHTMNIGRAPFQEKWQLARLRFAGRIAAGAPFTPGCHLGPRPDIESAGAGRPRRDLCPGKASRSMNMACTSIGSTPAVWAASTRNNRLCSRAKPADFLNRLHRAEDVAGVRLGDESGSRLDGPANIVGADGAVSAGRHPRQADLAGQLHGPERPADAVVLQIGGDDVVVLHEHAFEGHVQASVQLSVKMKRSGSVP